MFSLLRWALVVALVTAAVPGWAEQKVGGFSKSTLVSLTHDDDAYTANDVVGGLLTFEVFGGDTGTFCNPCSGVLLGATLYDDSTLESDTFVLVIIQPDSTGTAPATVADDDAFTISDADNLDVIACYTLSGQTYQSVSAASNAFVQFTPCQGSQPSAVPFNTTDGNLYGLMYTTGTPNPTSTADLHVRLEYLPDQP